MIPGSHKWGNDRFPDPSKDEVMRITMPAGSVALFVSTIWLVAFFLSCSIPLRLTRLANG